MATNCGTIVGPATAVTEAQAILAQHRADALTLNDEFDQRILAIENAISTLLSTSGSGGTIGVAAGTQTGTQGGSDAILYQANWLLPPNYIDAPTWDELQTFVGPDFNADPSLQSQNVDPVSLEQAAPTLSASPPGVDTNGLPTAHVASVTLPTDDTTRPTVATPTAGTPPTDLPDSLSSSYESAPSDDTDVPDVAYGGVPDRVDAAAATEVADASLATPTTPEDPDDTEPDAPTLTTQTIADVPALEAVTFPTWTAPERPEIPPHSFDWTETPLSMPAASAHVTYVQNYLNNVTTGAYQLPDFITDNIVSKAREQSAAVARDEEDAWLDDASARGMRGYSPALASGAERIRERHDDQVFAATRDMAIERARLAMDHFKTVFNGAVEAESLFLQKWNYSEQRLFDAERARLDVLESFLRLHIELIRFDYDDHRFALENVNQHIEYNRMLLQQWRDELEGQRLIGEIDDRKIARYNALLQAVVTRYELFKAKFARAEFTLQQNDQELRKQANDIDRRRLYLAGKEMEYRGYESGLGGERLRLEGFDRNMASADLALRAWQQEGAQTSERRRIDVAVHGLKNDRHNLLLEADKIAQDASRIDAQLFAADIDLFGRKSDNEIRRDAAEREAKGQAFAGYDSKMNGERTKAAHYQAIVSGYNEEVQAFNILRRTLLDAKEQEIKIKKEIPIQEYEAKTQYQVQKLQVKLGELEQQVRERQLRIERFNAEVGQSETLTRNNINSFEAAHAASDRELQRRLQELNLNINNLNQRAEITVNALVALSQQYATLLAGITSAQSASASLSSQASDVSSNRCDETHYYREK